MLISTMHEGSGHHAPWGLAECLGLGADFVIEPAA
jgi:hypothetical protein